LKVQNLESRLAPANITVLNANDSGTGSLRQAILDQNARSGPDTIDFDPTFFSTPRTINLNAAVGQLNVSDDLVITGPGAANLTINGGNGTRIFNVDNLTAIINVTISGVTVTGGNGSSGGSGPVAADGGGIRTTDENLTLQSMVITGNGTTGSNDGGAMAVMGNGYVIVRNSTISGNTTAGAGGGMYFFSSGGLLMENSTLSGNSSADTVGGGGIYFFGTVAVQGFTIRNSTISGNSASGSGGGIVFRYLNTANAPISIQNSTITNNSSAATTTAAGAGGGGISVNSVATVAGATAVLSVQSSIVSGNSSALANGRDDIASITVGMANVNFSAIGDADGFTLSGSSANNLPFGSALNLQPLGPNGGPTQTVALGGGSLAVNAGPTTAPSVPFDQRGAGFVRVSGPRVDIGAFEVQAATAPTVSSVSVNGGAVQRSRVTTLAVTFSTQVTFAGVVASAFTLVRTGGGSVGGFTATANVVNGVTVVTINNFTGAEVNSGSLRDGRFTLTVLANQISAGGINMSSNFTYGEAQGLYRFYGDINGDRHVDIADLGQFSSSIFAPGNYIAGFDFNNDGVIDIADFGQFSIRLFTVLP
jgi:hypothetical protein